MWVCGCRALQLTQALALRASSAARYSIASSRRPTLSELLRSPESSRRAAARAIASISFAESSVEGLVACCMVRFRLRLGMEKG